MKKELVYILFFYLALVIMAAILFGGCSVAHKNQKAFERVMTNQELADRTFRMLEKSRPCYIDTIKQIIQGEEVIRYDTSYQSYTDTLIDVQTNIKYVTKTKVVKQFVTRVDTFVKPDLRRLQLCQDDNNLLKGKILVLTESAENERKGGNRWQMAFFGLAALIVVGVILKIKKII